MSAFSLGQSRLNLTPSFFSFVDVFSATPRASGATAPTLFPSDAAIASSTARNSFFFPNLLARLLIRSSCHTAAMPM